MSRGFTIIEALCAFAILALALVALYGVGGTSYRMLARTYDSDRAALLAQSKLEELSADVAPIAPHDSGTFSGGDFAWRLESRNLPQADEPDPRFVLQDVRLVITRSEGREILALETRHLATVRR